MMINFIAALAIAASAFNPSVIAERRNAGNYYVYPEYVNFVRNDVAIQNPNYVGVVEGTPDEPLYFEFGYCYQLESVRCTWNGSDLDTISGVTFNKYQKGNVSNMATPYVNVNVPTFLTYSPANDYYYCRQYLGSCLDYLTFSKTATATETYGLDSSNTGYRYLDTLYRPSTSGPYYMVFDFESDTFFSYVTQAVAELNANSQTINANAYGNGYDAGKEAGYNEGYADGQNAITSEGLIVSNLFGAVFGVPIGVLNGLSPLVIWNIPIISIAMTFLFFSLILWLIKRFI